MCAILCRAVEDAFGKGGPEEIEIQQAQTFLTSGNSWFRELCELADVEPGCMLTWSRSMASQGWPRSVLNDVLERIKVRGGRDMETPEVEHA